MRLDDGERSEGRDAMKTRYWQCKIDSDIGSFLMTAEDRKEAIHNFLWFLNESRGQTYAANEVAVSEVVLKGLGYVGVAIGELPLL